MKVRALEITGQKYSGYYDHKRRLPGEIFTLVPLTRVDKNGKKVSVSPENQFSKKWMEKVDKSTPIAQPANETPVSQEIASDEVI